MGEKHMCVQILRKKILSTDHVFYRSHYLNLTPLQKVYKLLNN